MGGTWRASAGSGSSPGTTSESRRAGLGRRRIGRGGVVTFTPHPHRHAVSAAGWRDLPFRPGGSGRENGAGECGSGVLARGRGPARERTAGGAGRTCGRGRLSVRSGRGGGRRGGMTSSRPRDAETRAGPPRVATPALIHLPPPSGSCPCPSPTPTPQWVLPVPSPSSTPRWILPIRPDSPTPQWALPNLRRVSPSAVQALLQTTCQRVRVSPADAGGGCRGRRATPRSPRPARRGWPCPRPPAG